jgi:hypothetical protein
MKWTRANVWAHPASAVIASRTADAVRAADKIHATQHALWSSAVDQDYDEWSYWQHQRSLARDAMWSAVDVIDGFDMGLPAPDAGSRVRDPWSRG